MNILVKFLFLAAIAVALQKTVAGEDDADVKEFSETAKRCKDKLGISDEDVEEASRAHKDGEEIDENVKCLPYCIAQEMDILDANNKIDVSKMEIKHKMESHDIEKVNVCKAVHDIEDNECDYCYKMMGCMMSK